MSGPSLSLRGLDDLEYYLHAPHRPAQYIDVTGTGNTVDFRSTRAVQLTLDSLRYWAGDVGVDGFRFDLAVVLEHNATEFHPHHPLLVGADVRPWVPEPGKHVVARERLSAGRYRASACPHRTQPGSGCVQPCRISAGMLEDDAVVGRLAGWSGGLVSDRGGGADVRRTGMM